MGALAFPIPCGSICLFSCLGIICGAREGCRKPQAWLHPQQHCTAVLRCDHSSASSCSPSCNICISPRNFWGAVPVSGSCWASTKSQPNPNQILVLSPILDQTLLQSVPVVQYKAVSSKKKKPWIAQFQQFEFIWCLVPAVSATHVPGARTDTPKGFNPICFTFY